MGEPVPAALPASARVGFWAAFRFWLKLGCISFGGPAGQIAIMHEELVERRRWISERRFLHALNYCMLLPGPEAQQLATYIGWLMHGNRGGMVAGVLFVLPSLCILVGLSWIYMAYGDAPLIAGIFFGIKPAVAAIVFHAAWRIGNRVLKHPVMYGLALAAFLCIYALNLPFPAIVAGAALIGMLGGRFMPGAFAAGQSSGKGGDAGILIEDGANPPPHTLFAWPRFISVLALGALLWALPMLWLVLGWGWEHTLTRMSWFFTKAAFLTFGGAYAVLPYVYQGAVEHFGWLGATQMMDGLALGETTPGPLIMVVAFVGFVGAYSEAVLGPDGRFLAGALAAALVTWFTFLPSFLFILAGGPLVESARGIRHFHAPLAAITAAVVGVILNLALFFAYHVLWPLGWGGAFDVRSAMIMLFAAIALLLFRVGVLPVIAGCALVGYLIH